MLYSTTQRILFVQSHYWSVMKPAWNFIQQSRLTNRIASYIFFKTIAFYSLQTLALQIIHILLFFDYLISLADLQSVVVVLSELFKATNLKYY